MTPTIEENQSEPKFYEIDGEKYFINENGDMFRLDFDTSKDLTQDSEKWMQEASEEMEKKGTKGSFTEYCGGEVTQACIDKAKKSDDPKIRKKAVFAENARKISKSKDFEDEQVYKSTSSVPPEIKQDENMTKKNELSEDLTEQQYRENYWLETNESKLDGSTAMMETRIAKCIEAGGSFEECSKKVKAEMKSKGSENTNTEDMEQEELTEDATEEKKTEKVEVCKKEYDFLKEKYEELKKMDVEKKKMETDFAKWGTMIKQIQEEREAEKAQKRDEKIKQLSKDFQLPEEELKEDSLKPLLEEPSHDKILDFIESILDKAGKRSAEEKELDSEISQDFSAYLSKAQEQHEKLMAEYRHT